MASGDGPPVLQQSHLGIAGCLDIDAPQNVELQLAMGTEIGTNVLPIDCCRIEPLMTDPYTGPLITGEFTLIGLGAFLVCL